MSRIRETSFGRIVVREATPEERRVHGVAHVAEEQLASDLGRSQRDDLLDAAARAAPSEWIVRQRVLAIDRARGSILLEVDADVVPARARLAGRPMPIEAWLSAARAWMLAIDEQAGGVDPHRPHRWIVDVDQLGMRGDGRLVFGHGRLDSAIDTLWCDAWSEREIPPSTRSLVQWPSQASTSEQAAVKELSFALLHLLTGAQPLDGLLPQQTMEAWMRGAWGVAIPPGAEPLARVLSRGLAFDPEERPSDVVALYDALAAASRAVVAPRASAEPVAPPSPSEPTAELDEMACAALVSLVRVGWGREALLQRASDRLFARPSFVPWLERDDRERWLARWVDLALARVPVTSAACASLDRAERALGSRGVVFRQGYGSSLRAGMGQLAEEVRDLRERGAPVHGLAFFDVPAIEDAVEIGTLEIYFAAVSGDPRLALEVAREVRAALEAEGLNVTWTGARADPLRLEGIEWCAPLCESATKLVP